jgi:hypothetical protein
MREINGVVETKSNKDWNGIKLFSFQVEGDPRWYRTGRAEIQEPLGARIVFSERNNQVVEGSVKPTTDSAPATAGSVDTPTTTASVTPSGSMDVGERIRWQAARRDAVSVIVAALHTDALPWAKSTAKGKKLDLLRGYINEVASQFLEDENNG